MEARSRLRHQMLGGIPDVLLLTIPMHHKSAQAEVGYVDESSEGSGGSRILAIPWEHLPDTAERFR